MIGLRRIAAVSVGLAGVTALSTNAGVRPTVVPLASTVAAPYRPTAVLVHGLDSSKETFTDQIAALSASGYPAVALDLRGHGESPLGNSADFSPESLANDVLAAVHALSGPRGAVLVGHSMGGRIAMRAAALDAASPNPILKSVIIEDMDLSIRGQKYLKTLDAKGEQALALFGDDALRDGGGKGRKFGTWEDARASLLPWYDYSEGRVDGWRGKRVRSLPDGTSYWSDINPVAMRLACERVLMSDDGSKAWDELASCSSRSECRIRVWYADAPGTVVTLDGPGGIEEMRRRLPSAEYRFFKGAGHSIHNDPISKQGWMEGLKAAVDEAALRASGSVAAQVRGG
jgi:pimeloyl-ACP methyl ester carboxylesterase